MPDPNSSEHENFESAFTDAAASAPVSTQPPPESVPAEPAPASAPVVEAQPPADASAPAASPAPVGAPPTLSPYALAAQEAGLPFEGLTDAQIAQAMAQHIVRTRPYAQYGQQLAPHADQIRQYFDSQQQPTTPGQTPSQPAEAAEPQGWDADRYFTDKWNVPEWSEKYDYVIQNGMVQRNGDTGLYEATPGFESMVMSILPGLNESAGMTAQQWQGITRGNPYRQFYDVLLEPMRQAWQEDVQSFVAEYSQRQQQEQRINDFEASNASWLYGVDPLNGQRVLTAAGQQFYQAIATLREDGVADPQRLLERAMQLTGRSGAPPTQAQPPAFTPPSAPLAPPVPPAPVNPQVANQQQQQTFLQNALERASYSPQAGGYTQVAADHPVTVDENELNNMFVSGFRTARAGQT